MVCIDIKAILFVFGELETALHATHVRLTTISWLKRKKTYLAVKYDLCHPL